MPYFRGHPILSTSPCTAAKGSTHHLPILLPLVVLVLRRRPVHGEMPRAVLAHGQYRRHVPASVAIVGRGPDGDELVVEHVLVAFLHELMCTGDEPERVDVVEL